MKRNTWVVFLFALSLILSGCQAIQPIADDQPPAQPATTTEQAAADTNLSALLPFDSNVRTGKLENGLTYFVRQNAEPKNRAELWLAVNAGSVMEDDDQKGLAHLLEHMLFNGTKRFPKDALVDFLESIGMQFGADVNAYTSFDETVYTIQVPTDNAEKLGKSLDVLQDWASAALLEPGEIDAERGVVIEEWRLRDQGANGRIVNQWYPLLLAGSKYADRLPIGDVEIIRNAPAETVRRFYEKWYRPELMSVIAVGDFDPAAMEAMIQERFSTIAKPAEPLQRPTFDVPFGKENRFKVITDPEFPYTIIDLSYRKAYQSLLTGDDYRGLLLQRLADQMLNARFDEIAHQSDSPFLYAASSSDELVRNASTNGVTVQVQEDKVSIGLEAVLTELERVRQHGFSASELDRARAELLRHYESAYTERDKSDSRGYAQEYLNYFFTQEATPGIAFEYNLVSQLLPGIELAEINQQATALLEESGRDVLVIAPDKEGLVLPSETELATIVDSTLAKTVEPYVDASAGSELMAEVPAPAPIISESSDPQLGTTTIEFANGVSVILKPTDFKDDEIVFNATSFGGSSLVGEEDALEAQIIPIIVGNSGVGDLDYNQLTRLLSGKLVQVNPYIRILTEGMNGQASPKDLETLFQLIHLYATQPRADESAYNTIMDQLRSEVANRKLAPASDLNDAYIHARYGDAIRFQQTTLEQIDSFDLDRAFAIYKDRFADMNDFTFVFVGNFTVEEIKPLLQRYLGTLPGSTRQEQWIDVVPDPPTTASEETIYRGQDEQATTWIEFTGITDPSLENQVVLEILQNVVELRLTDELRERLGGTYSPSVGGNISKLPDNAYFLRIRYGSDPKRVDELREVTWQNLQEIEEGGPTEEEFSKTVEQLHRQQEENLRENNYWLGELTYYVQNPELDATEILQYNETVNGIVMADVQSAAQQIVTEENVITLLLLPEAYKNQ